MADPLIEEAKRLSEAATPGPWGFGQGEWTPVARGLARKAGIPMDPGTVFKTADTEFIARARTLVPELVERVERAERAMAQARRFIESYCDSAATDSALDPYVLSADSALSEALAAVSKDKP
jgi:hypothetical protein